MKATFSKAHVTKEDIICRLTINETKELAHTLKVCEEGKAYMLSRDYSKNSSKFSYKKHVDRVIGKHLAAVMESFNRNRTILEWILKK